MIGLPISKISTNPTAIYQILYTRDKIIPGGQCGISMSVSITTGLNLDFVAIGENVNMVGPIFLVAKRSWLISWILAKIINTILANFE